MKQPAATVPAKLAPLQAVSRYYALFAVLLFSGQSIAANAGALELVLPWLPIPVPSHIGRAIHLNLSIHWPLFALMGLTYYFAPGAHLDAIAKVALWQFVLIVLEFTGIVIALMMGYFGGGEYLEAPLPLKGGLLLALILWFGNLVAIHRKDRTPGQPLSLTLVALVGVAASIVLLIPNLIPQEHPIEFHAVRFLVVHLWEEGSIELVASGVFAATLAAVLQVPWSKLEPWLWWEGVLVLISGSFATAHHYYWLGTGILWKWAGLIFSTLQVVPVVIVTYVTITHSRGIAGWDAVTPALACLWSAATWNVLGVGLLGFFIAIPAVNRYEHGTYMTSSHAHLAVFGLAGFIALGGCCHLLAVDHRQWRRRLLLAIILLNLGLAAMAVSLFFAGAVQAYGIRIIGLPHKTVQQMLYPYFLIRFLGGLIFMVGGVGFGISLLLPYLHQWWKERSS